MFGVKERKIDPGKRLSNVRYTQERFRLRQKHMVCTCSR